MSFRIFASGSNNFHYVRNNNIDGSEFETMKILEILAFMDYSPAGVVDGGLGYVSPGISDLAVSLATIEFLHNLKNSVDVLAMHSGANRGWISVFSKESNTFWADDASYAEYRFHPGNNPGAEFVKKIAPGLKETDMNNFGVLRMLSIVLSKYSNKIGQHDTPMINIQLSK